MPITTNGDGNTEVALDIAMAMAIAPGLAKIVVYEAPEGPNQNDLLNAMLANSNVVNLSCSWGWLGGPSLTTDAIFESMDAVGQTFFDTSGDNQAFTAGDGSTNGVDNPSLYNAPSSNPYIIQVGGTMLAMNGAGVSWESEVVWNWAVEDSDPKVGSSGGISSYYAIPSWQTNILHLPGRGASAGFRNIPGVAANADHVDVDYGDGRDDNVAVGGTSCAAPIWAGFTALLNQQLAAQGQPPVGFMNPAIYAIAASTNFTSCFHDVTSGYNTWSSSPKLFVAYSNYDLCTGLGAMNGNNLINILAPPPAAPAFLAPVASAGKVSLMWSKVPGNSYQLQYTTDATTTNWINLGSSLMATGSIATAADTLTNLQRFYRVVAQ